VPLPIHADFVISTTVLKFNTGLKVLSWTVDYYDEKVWDKLNDAYADIIEGYDVAIWHEVLFRGPFRQLGSLVEAVLSYNCWFPFAVAFV